jgi:prolyl 4-hydroxylase
MKRFSTVSNKSPNFIGSWNMENDELCNEIIKFFEENKSLQQKGIVGNMVDPKKKQTTDITIIPSQLKDPKYSLFNSYFDLLNDCFSDYKSQYPFLNTFLKKTHIGHFNVQKYLSGDHFSLLHSERTSLGFLHRVFAWMTYLNNVDDGGTTDFEYYDIKVKPEIGKTLIWPAEWTHAHRGSVLKSGTKYIITGWIHFAS